MIERYKTKEMEALWSEEGKFSAYTEVEILVCEAHNKKGIVPDNDLKNIKDKAAFQVQRIEEIEKKTNHDLIAFVENLAENIGQSGRFVHMGLTSSDVIDTALMVRIKRSLEILEKPLETLINTLRNLVVEHKNTVCLGRTHGIAAEPTTFGVKLGVFFEELKRDMARLKNVKNNAAYGKLSGAVGTYSNIDPWVEEYVLDKLGLRPSPASTQVIQRDRIAEVVFVLSIISSTIEKIALEIRHLQRTEVGEAQEGFRKGQKGSSAMPHKKNPILSERLCGMARLMRANLMASMENIALWHERDISHSSVERVIIPDCFHIVHYSILKCEDLLSNLIIRPERMKKNIDDINGLIFSQKALLKLVDKGLQRDKAYEIVQRNAMITWDKGVHLMENLQNDKDVTDHLDKGEIEEIFSISAYLKNIDHIYKKMGV
ncbi:MAG: adenylosuccinate lyase [Candidatus Muiribacterium halophilum]|uniref:Adenylosuccinate lyase n=1 Tax=Muiribacterium halophilum TaxID=2053465 RepID=A0A2N5ZFX5_MUIH1|nr:MAG: adenylosuccinate lyase [Candidatus Muirbacterium halophilum]